MKSKKRPQRMALEDYLQWVMNNELEFEPVDWEKDCWEPRRNGSFNTKGRPFRYWEGKQCLMYQLTYMAWHGLDKSPFSQQLHAAHICNNSTCINPLHIKPKTPQENEQDKLKEPGWDAYREISSRKQKEIYAKGGRMPEGLTHKEKAQWILDNCTWTDENGCIRYTGYTNELGYGTRKILITPGRRKNLEMHRYIHCIMNDIPYGEDPNDEWNAKGKGFKVAHHKCEQPSCINPDHIELISRSDNALKITNNKARKITEREARNIIEEFLTIKEWPHGSKTAFCKKWAEKLNVSADVSRNIVFRKIRWKPLLYEYGLI